jgi:hypothetical protein
MATVVMPPAVPVTKAVVMTQGREQPDQTCDADEKTEHGLLRRGARNAACFEEEHGGSM